MQQLSSRDEIQTESMVIIVVLQPLPVMNDRGSHGSLNRFTERGIEWIHDSS